MAKQTFTTGQVLTAAQMTSLQQTAMGGGSTTAKTTSYVLVAADAGTVVQMNAAGATTITVNTALFSAGDTVQIQNVGAGVCTITAGTATVNTSATLALKQYDAGTLYFNTTSAAIFFAVDAADSTSPLTTKGDIYTFSTVDARLGVGTNAQVLTADSTAATGLKWATASAGALTKIGTYTFTSSASLNVNNCFSATYKRYLLLVRSKAASGADYMYLKFRVGGVDSSVSYYYSMLESSYTGGAPGNIAANNGTAGVSMLYADTTYVSGAVFNVFNPFEATQTNYFKQSNSVARGGANYDCSQGTGVHLGNTSFDGFSLVSASGTFTGEVVIYGYSD